jgi:hypothetical protein
LILYGSSGCGGSKLSSGFGNGSGSGSNSDSSGTGPGGFSNGTSGGMFTSGPGGSSSSQSSVLVCPQGLQCNVTCSGGSTTSITGKVMDPAGKNPLYNIVVYVPETSLQPLPKGLQTGAGTNSCSCGALFQSGAVVSTATAEDGTFTLNNAPVGSAVPLVIQVGKWRRLYTINVTACQDNPQPQLQFLSTIPAGDTNDSLPDIAVSTGGADTLECLMLRIGLASGEYVPGASTAGHVHVFSGGDPANAGIGIGGPGGTPELAPMPGAPESDTTLWDTSAHLSPYDILLLSCEGEETYNAKPANLEAYLNTGGRVFASHFHYAWFSGPIDGVSGENYVANQDWGTNGSLLATWSPDTQDNDGAIGGSIVQTLWAQGQTSSPFPKGVALNKWLGDVGALGQDGEPAADLAIYQPRYNAVVPLGNNVSQPWIQVDPTTASGESAQQTLYFSFDTPIMTAPPPPDGQGPQYCGRAVYSDLHVGGNPSTNDLPNGGSTGIGNPEPAPGGCDMTDLSPQEKALEFMIFDLSSCVIPDYMAPPDAGIPIQVQ